MVKLYSEDDGSIEFLQYLSHSQRVPETMKACDVGSNHVAFQVAHIDLMDDKVMPAGIRFHSPQLISSDGSAEVN